MLRPKAEVLSDAAMVPERNLQSPPTKLTHQVVVEQPYYYIGPQQAAPPEGKFAAGTEVKLETHDGGPYCQVVDVRGLRVTTAFSGLKPLE